MTLRYDDLIGQPYTDEQTCWQLVIELHRRQGIHIPDVFGHGTRIEAKLQQAGQTADEWIQALFSGWRRLEAPAIGSVVVFRDEDGAAVHAGVLVEPDRFIHATRKVGVTLARLSRPPWCDTLLGAYVYDPH